MAGTVRDNLLLGCAAADDTTMWLALGDAALDGVVRALPHGLDSWIGEDGARLSGGERRRLGLARALLSPAPWLLLDEPFAGLDPATRALVLDRVIRRLDRSGQGALIVSHQPLPQRLISRQIEVPPSTGKCAEPFSRALAMPTGEEAES